MSDQNLTPEVATQVNATYPAMLNNFRKITSWLKHGTASDHKLPEVVLNFLTKVDGIEQTQAEQVGKLDTLADMVEGYEDVIRELAETNTLLVKTVKEHGKVIAGLMDAFEALANTAPADAPADAPAADAPADAPAADAPKKRTKKAQAEVQAEPVATEAPKDKVQVTAAAVDAGDVSPEGFAQIDSIIDGLFAGVSTPVAPQAAPVAPSVSDLDEL